MPFNIKKLKSWEVLLRRTEPILFDNFTSYQDGSGWITKHGVITSGVNNGKQSLKLLSMGQRGAIQTTTDLPADFQLDASIMSSTSRFIFTWAVSDITSWNTMPVIDQPDKFWHAYYSSGRELSIHGNNTLNIFSETYMSNSAGFDAATSIDWTTWHTITISDKSDVITISVDGSQILQHSVVSSRSGGRLCIESDWTENSYVCLSDIKVTSL
jgi:hypothetical protein